jgi:hypothetical protein
MAAFLGDIAFLFGIVVAVAGLFTLHKAGADPRPALLKVAGVVLLVAGIGTALCTSYFYLKYHFAGDLEHPYPAMMHGKDGKMMMEKMMDKRMKNKQSSMDMPDDESFESGDTTEEDHETHH